MNSFRSCPEISSEAKQRLYVVGHILAVSAKASVACCSQVFDSIFPPLLKIFEAFGLVELVQLPLDPETGHCKGFGFVQFSQLEHAKAAPSVNEKLKIADRFHKISFVTDHIGAQDTAAKSMDLDDDEGGLALNAQSQEMLMEKLDRTGTATSIVGVSWSTCT